MNGFFYVISSHVDLLLRYTRYWKIPDIFWTSLNQISPKWTWPNWYKKSFLQWFTQIARDKFKLCACVCGAYVLKRVGKKKRICFSFPNLITLFLWITAGYKKNCLTFMKFVVTHMRFCLFLMFYVFFCWYFSL